MTSISTPQELLVLMDSGTITGNYTLLNDIDMSDYTSSSIDEFQGIFDGNGHIITIKNVSSNYVGLFKLISGLSSTIQNLQIVYSGTEMVNTNPNTYVSLFIAEIDVQNTFLINNCHLRILNDFSVSVNTEFFGSFLGYTYISSLSIYDSTPNITNCSFNSYGNYSLTNTGLDITGTVVGQFELTNVESLISTFHKNLNLNTTTLITSTFIGETLASQIINSLIVCKGDVTTANDISTSGLKYGNVIGFIDDFNNIINVNGVFNGKVEYVNNQSPTNCYIGCYTGFTANSNMENCNLLIYKQTLLSITPGMDPSIGAFIGVVDSNITTSLITNCTLLFGNETTIPGAEFIRTKDNNSTITNCAAIYKDYSLSALTGYGTCLGLGTNTGVSSNLPTNTLSTIQSYWDSLPETVWFNSLSNLRYNFNPEVSNTDNIIQIYQETSLFKIYSILNSMLYANIPYVSIDKNLNLFTTASVQNFKYLGYSETDNLNYDISPYLSTNQYVYLPTEYGVMNVSTLKTLTYQTQNSSVSFDQDVLQIGDTYETSPDVFVKVIGTGDSLLLETAPKIPGPYIRSSNYTILNIILIIIGSLIVAITLFFVILEIYSVIQNKRGR